MSKISLIILGTVQDAGSPHIGCSSPCCKKLFTNPDKEHEVKLVYNAQPIFDDSTYSILLDEFKDRDIVDKIITKIVEPKEIINVSTNLGI